MYSLSQGPLSSSREKGLNTKGFISLELAYGMDAVVRYRVTIM